MPPEIKKALLDAAKEAAAFQRARAPQEDKAAQAELKAKGMVINAIDRKPLFARAEPFWSSFGKDVQAEDIVKKILA